jgi:hypothetical protein
MMQEETQFLVHDASVIASKAYRYDKKDARLIVIFILVSNHHYEDQDIAISPSPYQDCLALETGEASRE